MNNETLRANDLTLVVPIYPPSSATSEATELLSMSAPAPQDRASMLEGLTAKLGALLDELQGAHRGGKLNGAEIQNMHVLQIWLTHLQAERKCAGQAEPPRK